MEKENNLKAHRVILLSLRDEVLREVSNEDSTVEVCDKLKSIFLKGSLANRLILKKKLCTLVMEKLKDLRRHMDDFNSIIFYLNLNYS